MGRANRIRVLARFPGFACQENGCEKFSKTSGGKEKQKCKSGKQTNKKMRRVSLKLSFPEVLALLCRTISEDATRVVFSSQRLRLVWF